MTWKETLANYQQYQRDNDLKEHSIATADTYTRELGARFDKDFTALTREDMTTWLRELKERGLSKASVRGAFNHARTLLRWLNDGENPPALKGLRPPRVPRNSSRIKRKEDLLTREEAEAIAAEMGLQWQTAFWVLRYSGGRPQDVLNLKWSDVTEATTKDGHLAYYLFFEETKNGESRTVPLTEDVAVTHLRRWKEIQNPPHELVFPSRRTGGPIQSGSMWDAVKKAAITSGVQDKKNVFPYMLRFGRATDLKDLPRPAADRIMGWTGQMWPHYTKLDTDDLTDALEGVDTPRMQTAPADVEARIEAEVAKRLEKILSKKYNGALAAMQKRLDDVEAKQFYQQVAKKPESKKDVEE